MLLKDRTKKRLRVFVVGVIVLAVGGGAAYFARDRYIEHRAVVGRDAGLKLLESGDYFHAMHSIGPYVRRHPDDPATLFAYSRARLEVSEPDGSNYRDAVSLLRRVMSLDPKNVPAAETLLGLYKQFRMMPELLQLSNNVLALDAKNPVAMKSKAYALFALGSAAAVPGAASGTAKDPALEAALAYNNLWPTDLEGQLLTLSVLGQRDGSGKQVEARANALHAQFPGDPRFVLLQSIARCYVPVMTSDPVTHQGATLHYDKQGARQILKPICKGEIPDAQMLQMLVNQCDTLDMFNEAYDALRRYSLKPNDADASALLAGRLWQLKLYDELAQRFPATVTAGAQTAALRCLALYELGRKDQAAEALGVLRQAAEGNSSAKTWTAVIEALHSGQVPDDAALIASCNKALRENDRSPYLQFILAEAYQRSGQTEDALQALRNTEAMAPAWSLPKERLCEYCIAQGDRNGAMKLAWDALQRLPNDQQAMLCWATARTMVLGSNDKAGAEAILADLQKLKGEPKVTPLRVQVLATVGRRDEAVSTIRQALDPAAKTDAQILMQLALISESQHFGLEDECFGFCEKLHGVSPDSSFLKARREIAANHRDQGLANFEKARASAGHDQVKWDTAWANLLEMTGDPRAKDAWISLAESNPKDAHLQWLALGVNSVKAAIQPPRGDTPTDQQVKEIASNRQAVRRILDRVKDDSITWRMDQAAWLLNDKEKSSWVEAALILNNVTRSAPALLPPKLMLAEGLEKVGDQKGEIDQLIAASKFETSPGRITLQLAHQLQANGDAARAGTYATAVLTNENATLEQCRDAASIVASQDDAASAAVALEGLKRAYGAGIDQPPPDVVLARIYRQLGQIDNALKVCDQMQRQDAHYDTIAFAVDLYDSQGRTADADAALKRWDGVKPGEQEKLRPGQKELVFGTHALRTGDRVHAEENFTAATQAMPGNLAAWRQLIRLKMIAATDEKGEQAVLETARAAQAATANSQQSAAKDSGFVVFLRQAPAAFKINEQNWPEILPLAADLLESPGEEKTFADTLKLLPSDNSKITSAALASLYTLAAEHPTIQPLQVMTVRACMDAGQKDDGCTIARKAAAASPNNPTSAQFAAVTYAYAGKWNEAIEMAKQWRSASSGSTLGPDRFIATAYVQLGDASAALAQLSPYLAKANAEPAKNHALIVEIAGLEAAAKSKDGGMELLRPHLAQDASWRIDWMNLALAMPDSAQAAARLSEIETQSMNGAATERLAYAESWQRLNQRSNKAYEDRTASIIQRVTAAAEKETMSAEIALALAGLHENQNDLASAEKFYRKSLELNPNFAVAQNNLAMVLVKEGEKLDEALALAQKAAKADTPYRPSFYDTLGLVQAKRHDYPAGITTIQEALKLKPNDAAFQIHLATMLADNNELDRAREVFKQVKPPSSATSVSPELMKEFESLQERLDGTKSPAARAS